MGVRYLHINIFFWINQSTIIHLSLNNFQAEKHVFQAEVNRMMKLIINSLYRNKEIFLRELISNASDALDKIRLLSLTDPNELDAESKLHIKIKADKDNKVLHIIDTGVGMSEADLKNHLGTIAKSGTADFLTKMQDSTTTSENGEENDLIGQFGVGFYSAFLVADKVVVTTKHNSDRQLIWESDAASFSIIEDPRGTTLQRGSQISLYLKDEAQDFLEEDTIKILIKKYSQFINFPIYLWTSKSVEEEIPIEEEEKKEVKPEKTEEDEVVEVSTCYFSAVYCNPRVFVAAHIHSIVEIDLFLIVHSLIFDRMVMKMPRLKMKRKRRNQRLRK